MERISLHTNLIISPHLDDAVFSLGGLIQNEVHKTKVITVFSGIPKKPLSRFWDRACGFKDSTEAMTTRMAEDRKALVFLGLADTSLFHLPYLDKQYRIKDSTSEQELKRQIAESIEAFIKKEPEGIVRIFIPLMEGHTDHRIVRDAVIEFRNKQTGIEIYLYQDVPYTFTAYLKKKITHPFLKTLDVLTLLQPSNYLFTKQVLPYTDSQYIKKVTAIELYHSQFRPKVSQLSLVKKGVQFLSKTQSEKDGMYSETVYKINL